MNFQRLRYFVVVAEELNFSRAAERLRMSQPPLSYQIKRLEEELGAQLFHRTKRSVRLTDAGRLLLVEARGLLVHAEQTASVVHRVGQGEVGRLTVGFVPSAANRVLPPILRAFGERFPSVELLLREVDPDRLLKALADGRVDVGFLYLPFEEDSLDSRPVSRETFVAALPDTHPLSNEPRVSLKALASEPFVLTPRYQGAGLRDKIVEHCRQAGFEPKVVQEAWLMQTTVSLVAGGIGVTLVPASLQNLQRAGVVYKYVEGLSPEIELGVVWRRGVPSAVLRTFLGVVEDVTSWGEGEPEEVRVPASAGTTWERDPSRELLRVPPEATFDDPFEESHMSNPPSVPSDIRGPDAQRASVSVTFDNLGEAADLERGQWPESELLGRHFSVRRMLPRILGMLDELGIRATFFVEGLNAELYPEALLEIANSGHELGYHGWRHEYWPNLSPSKEARLLESGVHKMDELGIRPRGFRPPGGRLTPSSPELLENLGFTHCSPAGLGIGFLGNVVVLPFEWRLIDAYYYLPRFGGLRKSATGSSEPLSPFRFRETLSSALQGTVRDGGHLTLLFHPFLEEQEDRFEIMRGALEELRELAEVGLIWCAPYRDVVSWVRERPGAFGNGLQLDPTEA